MSNSIKPVRIVVTVSNGIAEVADSENWPEGLELFVVHYEDGGPYHVNSPCDIAAYSDDTPAAEGFTGHYAGKVAETYRHD